MVDNTSEEQKLNKLEFEGRTVFGCATGDHNFDRNDVVMKPAGKETQMILKCLDCKQEFVMEAQLNVNELLVEKEQGRAPVEAFKGDAPSVKGDPYVPPPIKVEEDAPAWAEHIVEKYQNEKPRDDFWDSIKRGR